MKKSNAGFKEKTSAELNEDLKKITTELALLKAKVRLGQDKQTARITILRRQVAVIKQLLAQKD